MAELDLINRDPNAINTHLECRFEDVLAEPDGTHSIDCVWKLSYTCFNLWKKLCYLIMTTCCGIANILNNYLITRENNMHLDQTCRFEDVLAEPDGTHSIDCVWKLSYTCFNLWKKLCYLIMTTCCGICIAAEWGCEFAYVSFIHIWCITPCFKWLDINCGCMKKLMTSCISCCLDPICTSCGLLFHQFKK